MRWQVCQVCSPRLGRAAAPASPGLLGQGGAGVLPAPQPCAPEPGSLFLQAGASPVAGSAP